MVLMVEHECENCLGSGRFVCGRCSGRGCEDCGRSGEVECLFCVVYPRVEAERLERERLASEEEEVG